MGGRSMRTIRSGYSFSKVGIDIGYESESMIDVHLHELASKSPPVVSSASLDHDLDFSIDFSSSAYMSDVSGELQRLASLDHFLPTQQQELYTDDEPCEGFLERESFSTEIIESISPEDLQPMVKICVDSLSSNSLAVKRSAAAKLRLLAKNRSDNRALIGREPGAIQALITLVKSTDPQTQEHAVTALLNLSLLHENKPFIAGAVKSLIYVMKTGTQVSKQNGACALLSLALSNEEYKASIGASGAIPPLVSLLVNASSVRGKKDALTTLYKLCSIKTNKKRALAAGLVKPLVDLVAKGATKEDDDDDETTGMAEKAMVVLNSLTAIDEGKEAIVEQGGIKALLLLLLIQPSSASSLLKELAVITLLALLSSHKNDDARRIAGLMLGAIPALETLAQSTTTTPRAKLKAAKLLGYLKEQQHPTSSSSRPDSFEL
ncbi:U-box domain-containing protein 4 [Tanacetum coccineum]